MDVTESENFDSTNEDVETTDSTNGDVEITTDNDSDVTTTEETQSDDKTSEEPKEEYTEREKQLYARLKKREDELKILKGDPAKKTDTETTETATDELTITRLEVRGVMEPEDQEYVMRFAKAEGISALEALNDDIVKDRLSANKRARDSKNATPKGNNRADNAQNELAAAVRKYKRTGELPDDNPALTSKILDTLANEE